VALGTLIAGRYSCTWNAVDTGYTRTGFELEFQYKHEVLDESDLYGLTTVDAVTRGCDGFLSATLREYKAGSTALLWPVGGGVLGKVFSTAKPAGLLASDQALALVLTSTANTPAAAAPATLTASKAWIAPNYNPRIILDSRLREVPIRMQLFPYASASDIILFSTT
jgi:hypothetical protein